MRAVTATFGDALHTFAGFTDDTRWNGFLNIWVTPIVWSSLYPTLFVNLIADGDKDSAMALISQNPDSNGLYSLAYAYATDEVPPSDVLLQTHLTHCDIGEYAGVCKYGDDDCPVMASQNGKTPLPPRWMVFPGDDDWKEFSDPLSH